jgi:HprK-related kinase A
VAGLIGDLGERDLHRRLCGDGLVVDTGAVMTRIFSKAPEVAAAIRLNYGHYPLIEGGEPAHYRVLIRQPGGLRRFYKRQVIGDVGVAAPITPFPVAIAPLMVEMTMNWCVATRSNRFLIFHSAVLEKNGRTVILPGDSGQGKSTLCAALATSGWRLFSDEFGLYDIEAGLMMPNVRPVSLKNDSIGVMEFRLWPDVLTPPLHNTPKGTIAYLPAPREAVARRHEGAPPGAVIFPFYHPEAEPAVRPYPKARGMITLCGGAANYEMLGARAFQAMSAFVDRHPVCRIAYATLDDAIALVERIAAESTSLLGAAE